MLAALTLTPCLGGQPASIGCDHGLVVPLRVRGNDMEENGLLPKRRLATAILPLVSGGSRTTQGGDDLGGGVVGKVGVETHGRRIHGEKKSAMRKRELAKRPQCGHDPVAMKLTLTPKNSDAIERALSKEIGSMITRQQPGYPAARGRFLVAESLRRAPS